MRGFAVLRFDNRGIGESTGDWIEATDEDYALDAAAALKRLREKSSVLISTSGNIGHSQGGVKSLLAARTERPDFMIHLAGGAESLAETMPRQNADLARSMGASKEIIEHSMQQFASAFKIMRASKDRHEAAKKIEAFLVSDSVPADHARTISLSITDAVVFAGLDTDLKARMRAYDGPILSVYGGKDLIVSAKANEAPTRASLVHAASEVIVYPDLNHLMQPAEKGGIEEYWKIETTFDERVADKIKSWIATPVKGSSK